MMLIEAMSSAAERLDMTYRDGTVIDALPEPLRPTSRQDAYGIQTALGERIGGMQAGWKIAATSLAGQRHINVDGPLLGRLMERRRVADGGVLALGANRMKVAEIEFAFRMASSLMPRAEAYTIEEVQAAVESLHPAIEIPDSRYSDFTTVGADQLIADNACAHRFVIGPATGGDWRTLDLAAFEPCGVIEGKDPVLGKGFNVLGDPRLALTWAANELSRHGFTLAAGQIVMTGTCLVPMAIAAGDQVTGDFGRFGKVSLQIT
jgi:2-keto-4-pentenoate hydratase